MVGDEQSYTQRLSKIIKSELILTTGLQLFVLDTGIHKEEQLEATPLLTLLKDPYILIAAGKSNHSNQNIPESPPPPSPFTCTNLYLKQCI